MKIIISGGTGFIGAHLVKKLSRQINEIIVFTRGVSSQKIINSSVVNYVQWNPLLQGEWMSRVNGADVVINLVGKNVFESRWNKKIKQEILNSRIIPTKNLVTAISLAEKKPALLVSASAVGFYGDRNNEVLTEESSSGNDFLAEVVQQWESAAFKAEQFGVRVAVPRIGLVLEKSGGMIGKMYLPFQLFVGGPIGGGKQFLPWIQMEDVVRGILYPIENTLFRGAYNLVSPSPVTMKEFSKIFGNVLRRPSWIPVPAFVLSAMFGEGGKVILSGQRAVPKKLQSAGFQFSFTELKTALENILHTAV